MPTQTAQRNAQRRFEQLIEALKPEPPDNKKKSDGGGKKGGGAGKQKPPPKDGIPGIAQLKLLKMMQLELNERTKELDGRLAGRTPEEFTDVQRRERDLISQQQGEVARLTLNLSRRARIRRRGGRSGEAAGLFARRSEQKTGQRPAGREESGRPKGPGQRPAAARGSAAASRGKGGIAMNLLTTLLLTSALAAGDPGPTDGAKSPPSSGAAAKAKSPAAKPQPKKAGDSSALDDELFGDLAGELFEGVDKTKLDKTKLDKTKLDQSKIEKRPPPGKEPVTQPKPGKTASNDLPPEEFAPGEDIGQESNPLLDLGQRMRRAQSLISEGSTGDPTQRLQGDIVKDLDKLIELTKKSCPICNNCNSQGMKNQSSLAKAGQPKDGKGSGDFRPNPRPKGSQEGIRKPNKLTEAKTEAMLAAEKEVWGLLPMSVQEAIKNAQSSKVISEYATEVKDYFTRLAEMYHESTEK